MGNLTEQNLVNAVLEKLDGAVDPRFKQIMSSLVKHLHAFVREPELTEQLCKTFVTPLEREDLLPGSTRGVSNEMLDHAATVDVEAGVLLAVQPFGGLQ